MASGQVFEHNVDESSDIIHDFPCKPCSDDDKNVEGVSFCAECQTYFCQACIVYHNKCFKTHTLFSKAGVISAGTIQHHTGELMCDKHPGNPVQMYCGEHDSVCCAVCIAVDHRLCNRADFIPKLAKEILKGRDKNDVKKSLEEMKKKLLLVKVSKQEQITETTKEKENLLTEVDRVKERIIAKVEEIGQMTVKQVEDKHNAIIDTINSDIDSIDAKLSAVDRSVQKINEFKGTNESKLFVVLKRAHDVESGCSKYIESSCEVEYDKIVFEFDQNIEAGLSGIGLLGRFKEEGHNEAGLVDSSIECSDVSLVGHCVLKADSEVRGLCISDSCVLDSGHIILVDSSNGKLIRLDKTCKIKDVSMIRNPSRLCVAGPNELAVMCNDRIQFVYAGKSMVPTRSFNTPREDSAYSQITSLQGLTLSNTYLMDISVNDKLYVVVSLYTGSGKCKYAILVYELDGRTLERVVGMQEYINNISVNTFCVSSYESFFYIATKEKGLIILDSNGKNVSDVSHERLKNARSVCEGPSGQLFVCGRDTNNVFLVNKHDIAPKEILGSYDGIKKPISLNYFKQDNCLVVASEDGTVQVFKFS